MIFVTTLICAAVTNLQGCSVSKPETSMCRKACYMIIQSGSK